MTVGERIKNLREKRGYTLEELGEKIGVGKSTVRKWENGMIQNMRRDKIQKLAEVLNCSPLYLLGYGDDDSLYPISKESEPLSDEQNDKMLKFANLYAQLKDDEQLLVDNMISTLLRK